uniref:Serine/threonine-protein kinase n=1 Tax=Stegastes partitus TaxID=144197 RepID=A0A3B4ZZZ0_9TELE
FKTKCMCVCSVQFESKYEQQHMLGEGGCGSVFAGCRKSDNLPVAIKHVPKDKVLCKHNGKQLSIEVVAMLKIQARAAGPVGTISLLDWYDLGQELILVLERPVPCEDLCDYVAGKGGSLEEEAAKVEFFTELSQNKHSGRSRGIFHRDIKSENILIDTGSDVPRTWLIDFGLLDSDYENQFFDQPHVLIVLYSAGTVDHAPPEWHCQSTYRAGPTTVFQIGVVLFDMLHRDEHFETRKYFGNALQISDELSEDCQDFLQKCFALTPEQRPTLTELLLHPWLR